LEDLDIYTEAGCIEIYNNLIDVETANKIIDIFEKSNLDSKCPLDFGDAGIGYENKPGGEVRSNKVMGLFRHECHSECQVNEALDFIYEKWIDCVRHYQDKYSVYVDFDEGLQLLKYGPGKEYKPHADQGPGHEWRTVSGIIFLNPSDYEGGGTYFVNYDVTIKTDKPSMAIFPSNYAYTHRARAVLSGTKYAIVSWMGTNPVHDGAFHGSN
jgi:hypothetical protein